MQFSHTLNQNTFYFPERNRKMIHNDFGPRDLTNTNEKAAKFAFEIHEDVKLELKKVGIIVPPTILQRIVTSVVNRVLTKVRIMLRSDTIN